MPSSSSSKSVTIHESLPPPKQQQTFPHRRRSIKRKATLPQLTKSQSTLTQLDFATPRSTREVIETSSDEDCGEPQSTKGKKRKRKSKFDVREAGQSSMTQFERGDVLDFMKKRKVSEVDDEEFEVWEDYDAEKWGINAEERQHEHIKASPSSQDVKEDSENDAYEPEIPETSQPRIESSPRIDSSAEAGLRKRRPNFQTPRTVRFKTEVPSSQTPPSTRLSSQSTVQHDIIQRSPLKERSCNAQAAVPSRPSPESQNISMKMLEQVKFGTRAVPLNNVTNVESSPEKIACSQEATEKHNASYPPEKSRRLRRTNTIQDSQVDDFEPLSVPELREPHADEKYMPQLTEKLTVQNSQSEDMDLESPSQAGIKTTLNDNGEETQYCGFQSTYDPAYSALDRDAARFGRTQTQHPLDRIYEDTEDGETDEEDLDAGCMPRESRSVKQMSDESAKGLDQASPRHLVKTAPETVEDDQKIQHIEKSKSTVQDESAFNTRKTIQRNEIEVPSSPPLPHPSQVSTVVPTQISQLPHAPARQAKAVLASKRREAAQAFPIPSSPPNPASIIPEIMSSSPIPLPPWSSQEKAGFERQNAPTLESLVDFSLPPPPPLSSARSTR